MLEQGQYKYNINGVSKWNPGRSSWAYFLRDAQGDLVHLERSVIKDTNNIEAEERAILYAANNSK